jgi:hypothetical protein
MTEPYSMAAVLRLSHAVQWGMPDEDLRWHLKMVSAQADKTESSLDRTRDASFEVWAELYDDERPARRGRTVDGTSGPQLFARDDPEAPHYPLPIFFDAGIRGLRLFDRDQRPDWRFVEATFGAFLEGATGRLLPSGNEEPEENEP